MKLILPGAPCAQSRDQQKRPFHRISFRHPMNVGITATCLGIMQVGSAGRQQKTRRAGWAEVNASVTRATGKSLVAFIAGFIVKAR